MADAPDPGDVGVCGPDGCDPPKHDGPCEVDDLFRCEAEIRRAFAAERAEGAKAEAETCVAFVRRYTKMPKRCRRECADALLSDFKMRAGAVEDEPGLHARVQKESTDG